MRGKSLLLEFKVSTHSRLKAAGDQNTTFYNLIRVSTHSRLKAAGAG